MTKTKTKSIGRFNYIYRFNSDEAIYLTFNKKDYALMMDLLETKSNIQLFNRAFSKIHIQGLVTQKHDKNKNIVELYSGGQNCGLYHINDCTVQIFTDYPCNKGNDNDLAGIFIVNLDGNKREKALETLGKFFA